MLDTIQRRKQTTCQDISLLKFQKSKKKKVVKKVALALIISTTVVKYLRKSGSSYEFNRERAPKINQSGEHIFIGFYDQIHNSS
ncbi:hypothetical protein STEG23_029230 [Scotinomys teguina]